MVVVVVMVMVVVTVMAHAMVGVKARIVFPPPHHVIPDPQDAPTYLHQLRCGRHPSSLSWSCVFTTEDMLPFVEISESGGR